MESLVDEHHRRFITVLPMVNGYKDKLVSLNDWWEKITLIGKINSHHVATNILGDMQSTREKFSELQQKLIDNLLFEHVRKSVMDDSSRAQVAVDIVIRNLFERTADVGFLATDDDIRHFLSLDDATPEARFSIEERLDEYVKKYSVYDEIVILDTQGEVTAHLDSNNPINFSQDPIIKQTLDTNDEYVETFRHSDLQPNQERSLIYSCKITATNSPDSKPLGVLCLCFRFDNEMEGVFRRLLSENSTRILTLLDCDGEVIASSNPSAIALGERHPLTKRPTMIQHKGYDYLVNATQTQGYQGFFGLGWSGEMMSPVDSVFKSSHEPLHDVEIKGDIESSRLYSLALKDIHHSSSEVNEDLRLVVLNGKITAARHEAVELIPVLEAIKQIGEDTADIFRESIHKLQGTVISSRMGDVQFLAALAVDIMDRNLYERANDCRWWALTSVFRGALAKSHISEEESREMSEILAYINNLYTVYTNLYLYNSDGIILAVSNPDESHIIGQQVTAESGAPQALRITDSQAYAVSPFIATPYYDNQPTYIYNAAVAHPCEKGVVVGGIGIVFDSTPQFESMLQDALPKDAQGNDLEGCFGLFTQRDGVIVGATSEAGLAPGDVLELDSKLFALECGQQVSQILTFRQEQYVVGAAASEGYREYKRTGDYSNDVLAFIFVPF